MEDDEATWIGETDAMKLDVHSMGGDKSPAASSDGDLVRSARQGDKRAFVEIVARHQAMVCGVALGILGDFAASEDAGQEAFLTAWRKIHDLREPERLRAWLGQIARNAALAQLRRNRGHETLDDDLSLPDESPTPDQAAASHEEAELVREMLAKLPETYRLPLILFYREGKSVSAVAAALDLSEDAVKQRLARGREMLHQRMSGLIETTLERTRPNAVFTMSIAVAIGALITPAAVAGSVFSAASTAGTTSVSTTSIFTVMSTSKALLLLTAVVAVVCVPIGYQIPATPVPHKSTTSAESAQSALNPPKERAPSFTDSAIFAEWRGLHEQFGTNAQAMPALYKAIADLKAPLHRQLLRTALIAEWAEVDPAVGMKFMFGKGPDGNQRRQFFEEWLARDPAAAVDGLLAAGGNWNEIANECLTQIARLAPSRLAEVVSRLPKSESYWDSNVRDAFAILTDSGLNTGLKAAESITGPNRDQALSGALRTWAKRDLNAAIAWAKALPDGADRDEIIRNALIGRASVDPVSALESVSLVPPGGKYMYFSSTTGARVLAEASKTDFDTTARWVAAHPGRFGQEDLMGLSEGVTDRLNTDAAGFLDEHSADGTISALLPAIDSALLNSASGQRSAIWDWLKSQPESEANAKIRSQVLHSAAYQDPDLAMKLVADLPSTPAGDQEIQELARALFNGGSDLHRFDRLMAQAPERLRQPLIEQAFGLLGAQRNELVDDPQKWVGRLPLVPENSRSQATESLARAWSQKAPDEAAAWVAALPPGDGRNRATSAIAANWAASDAHGAADWVVSLPSGLERDQAAKALVEIVADKFPDESWQWAMSINDPVARNDAAWKAAGALASRDPAIARQMIESSNLTPEEKARLENSLKPKEIH